MVVQAAKNKKTDKVCKFLLQTWANNILCIFLLYWVPNSDPFQAARSDAIKQAAAENGTVRIVEEEIDGKRAIGYVIEKNKGLQHREVTEFLYTDFSTSRTCTEAQEGCAQSACEEAEEVRGKEEEVEQYKGCLPRW